jgi:hypothetical protein
MTPEQFVIYVQAIIDTEYEKGEEFHRNAVDQARFRKLIDGKGTTTLQPGYEPAKMEFIGPLRLIEKALKLVQNS